MASTDRCVCNSPHRAVHQAGTSDPILVLTRFRVRSATQMLQSYRDYQRVVRAAHDSPGLLRSLFLLENPTTFYSLSIWSEEVAIPRFGGRVPEHVYAGRNVFGRLRFDPARGPEIWSAKWKLDTLSRNRQWPGLDLGVAEPEPFGIDVRAV